MIIATIRIIFPGKKNQLSSSEIYMALTVYLDTGEFLVAIFKRLKLDIAQCLSARGQINKLSIATY